MTWSEFAPLAGDISLGLSLGAIAYHVIRYVRRSEKKYAEPPVRLMGQKKDWLQLPSGWSKQKGNLTGCVLQTGEVYHWWITRNGRTIIEGPAKSFLHAQDEVDAALVEFQA